MTGSVQIASRSLEYLFTVWVIVTLNFFLPRAMPGDPFLHLSGQSGEETAVFTQAQRKRYMETYGLDRPALSQYGSYLSRLLTGNLGGSLYYNEPVLDILLERLPWTVFLVAGSVLLSTFAGVILGGISAWFRGGWIDGALYFMLIFISEIPAFLLGLLMLFVFAAGMGWFPLSGAVTHYADFQGIWEKASDICRHAALPILSLAVVRTSGLYLLARSSMINTITREYVRTATAKGLSRRRILIRHVMRNAMLPIVTRVFLTLGSLVGGAILVENVFDYPGLGRLMREAVIMQDYPLIQGIFLLVTVCVLTANFAADFLYAALDPRLKE